MDIKAEHNKRIRKSIIDSMKISKVTAYRLCKDLKISQGNFSMYRHGKNCISGQLLSRILQYLKIN